MLAGLLHTLKDSGVEQASPEGFKKQTNKKEPKVGGVNWGGVGRGAWI